MAPNPLPCLRNVNISAVTSSWQGTELFVVRKAFYNHSFILDTCLKGKYYHELFCNWLLWPTIKHLGSWIGQEIMLGFQKNGLQRGRVSRTIFWTFRLKKHDFSLKVVNYDLYLFRKVAWLDIQLQNWAQPALVPAFTSRGFEVWIKNKNMKIVR